MSILLVPALIISFLITVFFVRQLRLGTESKSEEWKKIGIFFVVMLLGMIGREAYDSAKTKQAFNWGDLIIPLIVSPIVFGLVYTSLKSLSINVPSLVLSFQNGFFWSKVFDTVEGSTGTPNPALPTPTP